MNSMGNNGNGSRLDAIREWFLASTRVKTNDTSSIGVCKMNYMSQFKSSGGI